MKVTLATLLSFTCSLSWACIDLPTPIGLSNSSFENEPMNVSALGLDLNNGSFHYDLTKRKWCVTLKGSKATPICELKPQQKLVDGVTRKIIGIFSIDNEKRLLTLRQVMPGATETDFEIDPKGSYLTFRDDSSPEDLDYGDDRMVTEARDFKGELLGSITSTYERGSKGLIAGSNKKVDLATVNGKIITGCGGTASEAPRSETTRPASQLIHNGKPVLR